MPGAGYKYKFLNKEYESSLGLNVTETDFRQYDSALGRFNVMDALSELAPSYTPYRYGFNNPVYWQDKTGLFESISEVMLYAEQNGIRNYRITRENETGGWLLTIIGGEFDGQQFYDFGNYEILPEMEIQSGGGSDSGSGFAGFVNDGTGGFATGLTQNGQNGNRLYIGTARPDKPVNFMGDRFHGNGRVYIKSSYMGTVGKTITRASVAGSVTLGSYNIYQGVQQDGGTFGNNATVATLQTVGGFVGALEGATVGAQIGASIGVWFAGVGAAPGALVGGVIGGLIGGWAGSEGGAIIGNTINSY